MDVTDNTSAQASEAKEVVPSENDPNASVVEKPEGETRTRKKKKGNNREANGQTEDGRRRGSAPPDSGKDLAAKSAADDFTVGQSAELKTKISRLKGKLAKYSTKCNAINSRSDCSALPGKRSRSKDGGRKPRTTSESSAFRQEPSPRQASIRSMSFSASSTSSGVPGNDKVFGGIETASMGKPTGDDDRLPGRSDKKRQRKRQRSTNAFGMTEGWSQPHMAPQGEFILDSLSFFLLDMLFTPADKRELHIALAARNRGIVLYEDDRWKLNPQIAKWKTGGPLRRQYLYAPMQISDREFTHSWVSQPDERHPIPNLDKHRFLANLSTQRPAANQEVHRPAATYEDLVNSVVHIGLSEEEKKTFTLPVAAVGKRRTNYFKDGAFESNLEEFAQKCVDAGLGVIVEADVRISAKNNDHAFIKVADNERDAMISSQLLRKFALQGDVVRAFVRTAEEDVATEVPKCEPQQEVDSPPLDDSVEEPIAASKSSKAFVIRIAKEVHNRLVVGNFLSYRKNAKYITFVPRDMRMPNVRIYQESWPESFQHGKLENVPDTLYVAEIISWQDEVCVGRIKQAIGKCGELDSENRAILLKNNLRFEPFDEKLNEAYAGEYHIAEEEVMKREDLRKECIFTVDPLTAKDLDDALSIKELSDGNFEVGVHISDVTFFLDEDSELDEQVKKRTTSVYMVNEVFHMLPKPLCFRCSLLPGEDKLAFSVFWTMSAVGEVLSTRFARTVIRSCTQLAYQHAQLIIDNPDRNFVEADFPLIHNGFTAADIVRCVRHLDSLATTLRVKRFEKGALKIDRPKIYFDLDTESGAPIAYRKQEQLTANFLIEEFMLLANQSVAKFIHQKFPDISILRNHQPPLKNVLKRIKDQLLKAGLALDVSSSRSIYDSLGRLVSQSENPESASICLSQLVSKPMTRAKYFCSHDVDYENFKHYALSIPIYTHFTSPIRRYPDVLVHRVLAAALSYATVPKRTPTELKTLAERCNDDKYNAKLAGDDSCNLYFMHYVMRKGSVVMLAVVVELFSYSFEAILVETGTAISVNWKGHKGVEVAVSKESTGCQATLTYPSLGGKQVNLKLCSEVWLKVTVKSKRLKGELVPPPGKEPEQVQPSVCVDKGNEKEPEMCKIEATDVKTVSENVEMDDASDLSAETTESSIDLSDDAVEAVESSVVKLAELVRPPAVSNQPPVIHNPEAEVEVGVDLLSDICARQSLELARLLRIHDSSSDSAASKVAPTNAPADPHNTRTNKITAKNTNENISSSKSTRVVPVRFDGPPAGVSVVLLGHSQTEIDDDADIVIEAEEVLVVGENASGHPVEAVANSLGKLSIESSERKPEEQAGTADKTACTIEATEVDKSGDNPRNDEA